MEITVNRERGLALVAARRVHARLPQRLALRFMRTSDHSRLAGPEHQDLLLGRLQGLDDFKGHGG